MKEKMKNINWRFMSFMFIFIILVFFGYFSFVCEYGISVIVGKVLQALFYLIVIVYLAVLIFIRKRFVRDLKCFFYYFVSIFLTGLLFTVLFLCLKATSVPNFVFEPKIKGILSILSSFILFYIATVV